MRLSFCAAAAIVLAPMTSFADDPSVSYQLETSMATNYVFRGIVQYTNHDVASSQNTAAVTVDHVGPGTLSFTMWNATAMADYHQQPGNALEFDLSTGYTLHHDDTAVSFGYTAYLFPDHLTGTPMDGAHELSVAVAQETPYITPFAGVYGEFVRQQGAYLTAGATHDYKVGRLTVSPTVSIGGAAYRKYLGGDQSASPHLNDVTAGCAGKVDFGQGVYALLKVSYAVRLTPSDLVPQMNWGMDGRQSLYGALSIGVAR
jgi:hypothetical protein